MRTLEEIVRHHADKLDDGPELNYSGEVHTADINDVEYAVTITVTRPGHPDFYSMYIQERDK